MGYDLDPRHRELLNTIREYRTAVDELLKQLAASYGVENVLHVRKSGEMPRKGQRKPGPSFSFHGRGCRIWNEQRWVDVEFTSDGRTDAFDAGRIHSFIEENEVPSSWKDWEQIHNGLQLLGSIGALRFVERDLYTLVDSA